MNKIKTNRLFNPRTLGAWVILIFGYYSANAQQPYFQIKPKKKPTLQEIESEYNRKAEKTKQADYLNQDSLRNKAIYKANLRFDYKKFRVAFTGGAFHKRRQVSNPGPLINDKPFENSAPADPLLSVGISYKHSRWICPELSYSTIYYTDGDTYNKFGNLGASDLFQGKEITLGNRFYVVEKLLFKRIKLSMGISGKLSFLKNGSRTVRIGYAGTSKLNITNINTGDSLVFNRDKYYVNNTNFSLVADILLEVKLLKYLDLGFGVAYFQGFNKIFYSKTTYQFEGIKYQSEKSLFGTGYEPFIRLNFTLQH